MAKSVGVGCDFNSRECQQSHVDPGWHVIQLAACDCRLLFVENHSLSTNGDAADGGD